MNIILSKPDKEKGQCSISGLLERLYAYHNIYPRKITTSYNDFYDFWDVHVYRGLLFKEGNGHGTVQYQIDKWEKIKEGVKNVHGTLYQCAGPSWSWEIPSERHFYEEKDLTKNGYVYCPAIRFFLNVETKK